jgi:hypothetical protein
MTYFIKRRYDANKSENDDIDGTGSGVLNLM